MTAQLADPDTLMRALWDREVAAGRVPTGGDLARAGGASPATGRRRRQVWEAELSPELLATAATAEGQDQAAAEVDPAPAEEPTR